MDPCPTSFMAASQQQITSAMVGRGAEVADAAWQLRENKVCRWLPWETRELGCLTAPWLPGSALNAIGWPLTGSQQSYLPTPAGRPWSLPREPDALPRPSPTLSPSLRPMLASGPNEPPGVAAVTPGLFMPGRDALPPVTSQRPPGVKPHRALRAPGATAGPQRLGRARRESSPPSVSLASALVARSQALGFAPERAAQPLPAAFLHGVGTGLEADPEYQCRLARLDQR